MYVVSTVVVDKLFRGLTSYVSKTGSRKDSRYYLFCQDQDCWRSIKRCCHSLIENSGQSPQSDVTKYVIHAVVAIITIVIW